MEKHTSVSTTIRIPSDIYDKIEFEADADNSNISTTIVNVLRKHTTWDRFVGDIGFMYMQKPLLRALFDKLSDKEMSNLAKTIGYTRTRDAILFINGKFNVTGILKVVKLWLRSSNIPIRTIEKDDTIEFIVQHNLGPKWSIYFTTVLKTLFAELNISTIDEDIEDHTVELTFSLNQKIKKKKK